MTLAESADTILYFVGLDEVSEAEGIDRRDMKLPQNQLEVLTELTRLGKKVVAVLVGGSAVEFGALEQSDAILYACLGGQAGARAILDILTGKINPSANSRRVFRMRGRTVLHHRAFPARR